MRFVDGTSDLVNQLLSAFDHHVGHALAGQISVSSMIQVGNDVIRNTNLDLSNESPNKDPNGFFDPVFLTVAEIVVALLDQQSLPEQHPFLNQLTDKSLYFDRQGIRICIEKLDILLQDLRLNGKRYLSKIAQRTNNTNRLTDHISELRRRLITYAEQTSNLKQKLHCYGGLMTPIGLWLSACLIFVALWGALWGFNIVASHHHLQRFGITAEAQIVHINQQYVVSQYSNGLVQRELQVFEIIRFTLKNNTVFETPLTFELKSDVKPPRPIGSRIPISYDPNNPKEVIDISTYRAQWLGWLTLGLSLITAGVALLGLFMCTRLVWFECNAAIKVISLLGFALISLVSCRQTWQFWEAPLTLLFTDTSASNTVSSDGLILTTTDMKPFSGTLKEESLAVTTLTHYHQGKRNGVAQTFIKGRLVAFETYHDDMRVGPFLHADDYGRKTATGRFNGGHLDGDYLGFNPTTGLISEKGRWHWGDKVGAWSYFHSNGSLALEEHYLNGQLEGVRKEYNEHGNLLLQAEYVQGQLNGLYIKYWPNGPKALETTMAHGQPNGPYTTFYKDGTIKETGIMQNGQWTTAPTFYGEDSIVTDDEPSITIRELTPEEVQALEAKAKSNQINN